jgi:hypothetical protein
MQKGLRQEARQVREEEEIQEAQEEEEPQMTATRIRSAAVAGIIGLLCLAGGSGTASAATTHPFESYINLPGGGNLQPQAFDEDGNLIVWSDESKTIEKFDPSGNPVPFSATGTNQIDGAGGFECPTVPTDCDRVPSGSLGDFSSSSGNETFHALVVDHSGGPADGYIYFQNNHEPPFSAGSFTGGEINVFAPSGKYLGNIDQTQATPSGGDPEKPTMGIAIDKNGVLYLTHENFGGPVTHVDRYVPVDGDPSHNQFSGQIRTPEAGAHGVAAGENWIYVGGGDYARVGFYFNPRPWYAKYTPEEFQRQGLSNYALSQNFTPETGPFHDGGYFPPFNSNLEVIAMDPETEHVYIGLGWAGIEEFDPDNNKVGPSFGGEGCPPLGPNPPAPNCHIPLYGLLQSIAIDRTGGVNDGKIFTRGPGSNQIAVFGRPATIPDIEDVEVEVGHTEATISATVGLAGGPEATSCEIEYGTKEGEYVNTVPCDPGAPYAGDQEISADLTGLVVEGEYHFRIAAGNANGVNYTDDGIFRTRAVLGVTTDPASNLTSTGADLNGSLDPDGLETSYRFEYGISELYNNKTPLRSTGSGSGLEQVDPVTVTGLQAGRTYHYRIVATNSLGKTRGADRTFIVPAGPRISGVRATDLTETSAVLNAQIDPLSFDTAYYFEYGPTPDYGSVTPTVDLGSGTGPEPVSTAIDDLLPGATYFFRLVATNEWGTTHSAQSTFSFQAPNCPNAHVRQQTNASYLPDCRAYELVSPGNAGAVTLFPGSVVRGSPLAELMGITSPNAAGTASSPPRFGFFGGNGSVMGIHPPNALIDRYVSTRTTSGWVTRYPGIKGDEGLLVLNPVCSANLEKCIDARGPNPFEESDPPTGRYLWGPEGESLGRLPTNLGVVPGGEDFIGDTNPSPDFSHFVFSSRNVAFAPGGLEESPGSAYDNEISSGKVTLISKLANGDPIPADAGPADEHIEIPAVSTDGSHILMTTVAQEGMRNLYMRVDGLTTHELGQGNLIGVTADGSKVAFVSTLQLDSDDTDSSADAYLWDEDSGVEVVSHGNGNGDGDECGAFFTEGCGVTRISTERPELDDTMASRSGDFYFYSPEQLDPANPGVLNERNLYVYRDGAVHYVATFDPDTQVDRMQVSDDGDRMAFLSRTKATGYDNVSLDDGLAGDTQKPEAWQEMYTWDADTGELLCASCIPSGGPPAISSLDTIKGQVLTSNKDVKASLSGRFMSDDGRVAFATADPLVPADTNGKIDVDEFVGNRPQLITSGTDPKDTQGGTFLLPTMHTGLEAFSRDGADLYFSTFETFVPNDFNGSFVKFYDARIGGGFPIVPPLLPCTAADECHGDGTSAPGKPSFSTSAPLGAGGNLKQQAAKGKKKGKKKGKGKKAAKKAKKKKRKRNKQGGRR